MVIGMLQIGPLSHDRNDFFHSFSFTVAVVSLVYRKATDGELRRDSNPATWQTASSRHVDDWSAADSSNSGRWLARRTAGRASWKGSDS